MVEVVAMALSRMAYMRFDTARFMQRGIARDKGHGARR